MQNCPNCHSENMEGVVFCQHCGVALVPVPISTRQFDGERERSGTGTLSADGVVLLHIDGQELPQTIQLRRILILGRFNEPSPNSDTTYFDLTEFNAESQGVSRRHAQLTRHAEDHSLSLSDLHSTNGTHLNGNVLMPAVETPIHDGDEIRLGKLKMYIYFRY